MSVRDRLALEIGMKYKIEFDDEPPLYVADLPSIPAMGVAGRYSVVNLETVAVLTAKIQRIKGF